MRTIIQRALKRGEVKRRGGMKKIIYRNNRNGFGYGHQGQNQLNLLAFIKESP